MTPSEDEEELATEAAALWVLAFEETPDDPELQARFDAWLNRDPRHAAAWADASRIYDMVPQTPPAHSAHWAPYLAARQGATPTPGASPHRARQGATPAPRRFIDRQIGRRRAVPGRLALGALGLGLAVFLIAALTPDILLRVQADHVTSTAEVRSLDLEDGTAVSLAPDSAIAVAFDSGERKVELLQGEAFFEVTSDPDRAFRVTADEMNVTVLGTAFNVRLADRSVSVAVREGLVGLRPGSGLPPETGDPAERLELTAGDWAVLDENAEVRRGRLPPDEIGAWREGRLVARERAMSDVLDDLRRYHTGLILLTDPALGTQKVTGIYNLDDPVAAVRVLASPLGASVRQITPWLLVVSPE